LKLGPVSFVVFSIYRREDAVSIAVEGERNAVAKHMFLD